MPEFDTPCWETEMVSYRCRKCFGLISKDTDYCPSCQKIFDLYYLAKKLSERYYGMNSDYLPYHNLQHAKEVAMAVSDAPNVHPATVVAAIWHDAIYIPGSKVNEQASADALRYEFRVYKPHANIAEAAALLVEQTKISDHLTSEHKSGQIAYLLDADIHSLGLPTRQFSKFITNQENILVENGAPINKENLKKCAEFLSQFLTVREHIYHTPYFRHKYESLARSNIKKLMEITGAV